MSKKCKLCNRGVRFEGHPYCLNCWADFTEDEKEGVLNKVKNSRMNYDSNKSLGGFF